MNRAQVEQTDHEYMYAFRTNPCTKMRCTNPSRCFDVHSQVTRRRVPTQDEQGHFNYIPEPCPQWKQMKKCSIGESCHRAHGWLEVIFHPLLYKTKMCRSYHRKGVCHEYGVYCAKAHHPSEIRNLVKIYGEGWKSHYDLSNDEKNPISIDIHKSKKKMCYETAIPSKMKYVKSNMSDCRLNLPNSLTKLFSAQNQGRNSTRTSPKLNGCEAARETVESPALIRSSPPLFGEIETICHRMSDLFLDVEVKSYVDLYADNLKTCEADSGLKLVAKNSVSMLPWERTWCSTGPAVSSLESCSTTSSNAKVRNACLDLSDMWDTSCSDGSCKADNTKSETDMEHQLQRWHYYSQSLFARPNYEANQNK